jgi:hypothetical protein
MKIFAYESIDSHNIQVRKAIREYIFYQITAKTSTISGAATVSKG